MASILRNPRVLLVFCMTASISAAAPSSNDQEHHGRITMQVEIQNRTYAIPSSPGQEHNSKTVPSVNSYRAAGYSSPTAYNRPYQSDRTLNGPAQTYHANPRSVPADSRRYTGEGRPAAYSRSYVADRSYNRPSESYYSNHRNVPADSHRYTGQARPAANSGHYARDESYNKPTQTYRSNPSTNPADSSHYSRPAAQSTPYVPDGSYNRPSETHPSNHRTDPADSRRYIGEARPESYARSSQPEISSPRQTHTGERNRARVNQRRRYVARTDNRDRTSVGGSRYGIRRRIYYNNPSENEQTEREREIRVPLPRPQVAHTSHSNANQNNERRKKWIQCHHDGIAFVSQEADPEVLGI